MSVRRVTQAMLERAVGGADVLVELMDKDGDGIADADAINEILDEIDAEANSYISNAVDVADPSVDTAPLLLMREKACGAYLCWLRGTRASTMPESVKLDRDNAIQWYMLVGDRKASVGTAARVAGSQPVKQVATPSTDDYFRTRDTAVGPAGPRGRYGGWA